MVEEFKCLRRLGRLQASDLSLDLVLNVDKLGLNISGIRPQAANDEPAHFLVKSIMGTLLREELAKSSGQRLLSLSGYVMVTDHIAIHQVIKNTGNATFLPGIHVTQIELDIFGRGHLGRRGPCYYQILLASNKGRGVGTLSRQHQVCNERCGLLTVYSGRRHVESAFLDSDSLMHVSQRPQEKGKKDGHVQGRLFDGNRDYCQKNKVLKPLPSDCASVAQVAR